MSARQMVYNSPYIEASITAYLAWMEQEWVKYSGKTGRRLKAASVGNLTDLRKAQDQTRDVKNPLHLIALARIEPYSERGGISKKFTSMATSVDRKAGTSVIRNMIPVRLGFMSVLRTDNITEVLNYSQLIMNSSPGKVFSMRDNSGFVVDSRIYFDPTIEIPQVDSDGVGDQYNVELPFSITTWIGTSYKQGIIKEIQISLTEGVDTFNIPVHIDKETGKVIELESYSMKYTDIFDKNSSYWKGD